LTPAQLKAIQQLQVRPPFFSRPFGTGNVLQRARN
jgi:hypothetical protein